MVFFAHLTFFTKYSEFDNFDFINRDMLFLTDVTILAKFIFDLVQVV